MNRDALSTTRSAADAVLYRMHVVVALLAALEAIVDAAEIASQRTILTLRLEWPGVYPVETTEEQITASTTRVASMLSESSYGQAQLDVDGCQVATVTPVLPATATDWDGIAKEYSLEDLHATCPLSVAAELAHSAAVAAGLDPDSYTQLEIYMPCWTSCGCPGMGGKANRGCPTGRVNPYNYPAPCRVWMIGHSDGVRLHEMGHNFGLMEGYGHYGGGYYADTTSVMGVGQSGFNAFERLMLGWLPGSTSMEVTTGQAALVTLNALSRSPLSQSGWWVVSLPRADALWGAVAYDDRHGVVAVSPNWASTRRHLRPTAPLSLPCVDLCSALLSVDLVFALHSSQSTLVFALHSSQSTLVFALHSSQSTLARVTRCEDRHTRCTHRGRRRTWRTLGRGSCRAVRSSLTSPWEIRSGWPSSGSSSVRCAPLTARRRSPSIAAAPTVS